MMSLTNEYVHLQLTENEIKDKTDAIDDKAKALSVQSAIADKYATTVFEMIIYEQFNDILLNIDTELRTTATLWQQNTKPSLMRTVNSLGSFCRTYISYFPELLEELNSGAKDISSVKDSLLNYIGEVLPKATQSSSNIANAKKLTNEFVDKIQNNKDKLTSKVIPNIEAQASTNKVDIDSNNEKIDDIETQILITEERLMQAIYGTVGSSAALGVGGAAVALKKPIGKLAAKIAPNVVGRLAGRIAGRFSGKFLPGLSIILVVVDIAGLLTSVVYMQQFKAEMLALRNEKNVLLKKNIALDADITYLTQMQRQFEAIVDQSTEVGNVFNSLSSVWSTLYNSLGEIQEKLKTLDMKLQKNLHYILGAFSDLNSEFISLREKLQRYELGFILPIKESEAIDLDSQSLASANSTLLIPNHLYTLYNNKAIV